MVFGRSAGEPMRKPSWHETRHVRLVQGHLSSLNHCGLILLSKWVEKLRVSWSPLEGKKKARNDSPNLSLLSSHARKKRGKRSEYSRECFTNRKEFCLCMVYFPRSIGSLFFPITFLQLMTWTVNQLLLVIWRPVFHSDTTFTDDWTLFKYQESVSQFSSHKGYTNGTSALW